MQFCKFYAFSDKINRTMNLSPTFYGKFLSDDELSHFSTIYFNENLLEGDMLH